MGDGQEGVDGYNLQGVPFTFDTRRLSRDVQVLMDRAVEADVRVSEADRWAAQYPVQRGEAIWKYVEMLLYSVPITGLWCVVWPFIMLLTYYIGWYIIAAWLAVVAPLTLMAAIVNLIRLNATGAFTGRQAEQLGSAVFDETLRQFFWGHVLFWFFPFIAFPWAGTLLVVHITAPGVLVDNAATAQERRVRDDTRSQVALSLRGHVTAMNGLAMLLRSEENARAAGRAVRPGAKPVDVDKIRQNLTILRGNALVQAEFLSGSVNHGELGTYHGDVGAVISEGLAAIAKADDLLGQGDARRQAYLEVLQLEMKVGG